MPKDRLAIVFSNFGCELSSDLTGADRLERIHQSAGFDVRVCIHQEVDVIGLTVKLNQLAVGVLADPREVFSEPCQDRVVQCFPSVLRHENYVVDDSEYTVPV